jgi:predicted DNA-binding protein (MmcQ/YjbR family)
MTLESLRHMCRALPDVTEDIKWEHDLCFCIGRKMFAVVGLEPPHPVSFKCTPEDFGDLVEREGLIPAPYLARAMWVQAAALGESLDRRELERLLHASYTLVKAKLPKRARSPSAAPSASRGSRSAAPAARRRRR